MLSQRLVGAITVKDGWAVQSFGYARYLPLGRAELLAANLDRWGVDEILLQCIDRQDDGPDLALLERVSRQGLGTPLIYAGGLRTVEQAVAAVKAGADRICLDALLHDAPYATLPISERLGAQAVVASLPIAVGPSGAEWLDYRSGQSRSVSLALTTLLRHGALSEILLIDWRAEGNPGAFDERLLSLPELRGIPLIAFGGLGDPTQVRRVLTQPGVVAIAQGNLLSYREHAVQTLRSALIGLPLRPACYARPGDVDAVSPPCVPT